MKDAQIGKSAEDPRKAKQRKDLKNRIVTNLKPHLRSKVEGLAIERGLSTSSMARILIVEALEHRGFSNKALLVEYHRTVANELESEQEAS
jgi:hypothetical protein